MKPRPLVHSLGLVLAALTTVACTPHEAASSDPVDSAGLGAPVHGSVGPTGGTVDRLLFAFHGDTRPPDCDQTAQYPTAIIRSIFEREAALGVEFAVDLGDHMYVCNGSLDEARLQMGYYTSASKLLGPGKLTFLTMGNHECQGGGFCDGGSHDANSTAFREALRPLTGGSYYYSFEIGTRSGRAVFVVIADNAFDRVQRAWLEATLDRADRDARYTIVVRHHPVDNHQLENDEIWRIIRAHKYSLLLTGHAHEYRHDLDVDPSGRSVRMGTGGAPLLTAAGFFGFGTVTQGQDDRLYVQIYDEASGSLRDAWSVAPQEGPDLVHLSQAPYTR